jgi:hypothetical protein
MDDGWTEYGALWCDSILADRVHPSTEKIQINHPPEGGQLDNWTRAPQGLANF